MPDVMHLARAERAQLADLLETLTPQQWEAQSLCSRWSVKEVAAHVISFEELGARDMVRALLRSPLRPDRLSDGVLAPYAAMQPEELVGFYRLHLTPTGVTGLQGGAIALVDAMIHQQDIRRPLGLPRPIDEEALRFGLGYAVTAAPLRGFWHARGVRLEATDLDWSRGRGPVASGPGEALLMALAGRRGAAADLEGPGAGILADRLG